jgi:glycosyltransferase involved in cell wall biosynthesis
LSSLSIVHTESSLGWGGQEIRILSESHGLIRRGHEVKLLCPSEARIYAEAKRWGVPAIALPIARKRPVGVKVLYEWLKRNRCDVVSTHSSTDSWLAAFALLALGRRVPMVRTRHISAPVPKNWLSRWLYTRATARIVTAGESLKKELIERNGFPPARIDSVPTGVDARRFRPGDRRAARQALELPQDKILIGIVATLRSWKGHRYLIEALAGLPEAALVIVGDGPMREVLETEVEKRGVRSRTSFAGNQPDVVPWLHALDIFALPSYANEGVPQALMQAMLVGLPCVTTSVGSIGEVAIDEATALVVPPHDSDALRKALRRLMDDTALRKKLGEAARRLCTTNYSYDGMLARMEAIYRQVSGRR